MYFTQTEEHNCGPTALVNLQIWSGKKVTKTQLAKLTRRLTIATGTRLRDLIDELITGDYPVGAVEILPNRRYKNKFINHLKSKQAGMLAFKLKGTDVVHLVFTYKKGKYIYLINHAKDGHAACNELGFSAFLKSCDVVHFILLFK